MATIPWAIIVERDDGAGGLTLVDAYTAEAGVSLDLDDNGGTYGTVSSSAADVKALEVNRRPWSDTLEINIQALPGSMDIQPLDVINVWVDTGSGTIDEPVGVGYVVECPGDGDSANVPRRFRALGLSNYLRYVGTGPNQEFAAGQEVRVVAESVLAAAELPVLGLTAISYANTGVTTAGKVNPDSADLLQVLEGLASLAASGGQNIRVYVGMTLGHFVRFQDPFTGAETITLSELDDDVRVNDLQIKAQRRQTKVVWILGDGSHRVGQFDSSVDVGLDTPDIRTYTVDSGETPVQTVVLEPPESQQVFVPAFDYSDVNTNSPRIGTYSVDGMQVVESGVGDTPDTPITTSGDVTVTVPDRLTVDSLPYALSAGDILIGTDINNEMLIFAVDQDYAATGSLAVLEGLGNVTTTPWNGALNTRNLWLYSRCLDGSRTSYVEFEIVAGDTAALVVQNLRLSDDLTADEYVGFLYDFEIEGDVTLAHVELDNSENTTNSFPETILGKSGFGSRGSPVSSGDGKQGVALAGDRAKSDAVASLDVGMYWRIDAGSSNAAIRWYQCLPIAIDTQALDALAEREFRSAELSSVRVQVNGYAAPSEFLNLTLADGTTITGASIGTYRYIINGEDDRTELIVGERESSQIVEQAGNYISRDTQATVRGAKLGGRRKR